MKRNTQILVRVTPDEKAMIQSGATSIGTNVSRLLRLLGLKAKELNQLITLIRQLTARLLRLKSLSKRRLVAADELQSAVNETLEPLRAVEEALQTPPNPDHLE